MDYRFRTQLSISQARAVLGGKYHVSFEHFTVRDFGNTIIGTALIHAETGYDFFHMTRHFMAERVNGDQWVQRFVGSPILDTEITGASEEEVLKVIADIALDSAEKTQERISFDVWSKVTVRAHSTEDQFQKADWEFDKLERWGSGQYLSMSVQLKSADLGTITFNAPITKSKDIGFLVDIHSDQRWICPSTLFFKADGVAMVDSEMEPFIIQAVIEGLNSSQARRIMAELNKDRPARREEQMVA